MFSVKKGLGYWSGVGYITEKIRLTRVWVGYGSGMGVGYIPIPATYTHTRVFSVVNV